MQKCILMGRYLGLGGRRVPKDYIVFFLVFNWVGGTWLVG